MKTIDALIRIEDGTCVHIDIFKDTDGSFRSRSGERLFKTSETTILRGWGIDGVAQEYKGNGGGLWRILVPTDQT